LSRPMTPFSASAATMVMGTINDAVHHTATAALICGCGS
jgi:hypothetical protein